MKTRSKRKIQSRVNSRSLKNGEKQRRQSVSSKEKQQQLEQRKQEHPIEIPTLEGLDDALALATADDLDNLLNTQQNHTEDGMNDSSYEGADANDQKAAMQQSIANETYTANERQIEPGTQITPEQHRYIPIDGNTPYQKATKK